MIRNKVNTLRNLIVGVNTSIPLISGQSVRAINFDNAATTPPFKSVMNAVNNFSPWYSSIHRGAGYKSVISSVRYEQARKTIGEFVGADPDLDAIIFVKNTTEALNKLSYRLYEQCSDCVILSTLMEHHSNDLPWRENYHIDYIAIDELGRLSLEDLEMKLKCYSGRVKLVTITGASNVTGHINPINEIADLTHRYGAKLLVDGAQLVPHAEVNMKSHSDIEHIDFLVFSAHKMYAPFGSGVLIGPRNYFEKGSPDLKGGGTVKIVTKDIVLWDDPPHKDEAGTPNLMGVIALDAAIKTLKKIGMKKIEDYERYLTQYALKRLIKLEDIEIYGDYIQSENKVSIITFNIKGIPHDIVANYLSLECGIAVRNGCFCAQPYVQKLLHVTTNEIMNHIKNPNKPHPGMVRMSFGLYNTIDEIDDMINALEELITHRSYYLEKYEHLMDSISSRTFNPLKDGD
ncbi:aminotransferase class V-fold PLP-dependent enzyme [Vallitalea okinawensis]|uniref:aminotransferase class V-fold PLP-dependent enzyme n=1 Tax=Vallitalea okinawensis TaxID=2078660 RepID=UPI000CFD59DD|nr:aminotransferase class V-fold PLP-dependent enzyme [Vallitalea okinawensis]